MGGLRVNTDLRRAIGAATACQALRELVRPNFTIVRETDVAFDVISTLCHRGRHCGRARKDGRRRARARVGRHYQGARGQHRRAECADLSRLNDAGVRRSGEGDVRGERTSQAMVAGRADRGSHSSRIWPLMLGRQHGRFVVATTQGNAGGWRLCFKRQKAQIGAGSFTAPRRRKSACAGAGEHKAQTG